jgi:transmembrane protein 216
MHSSLIFQMLLYFHWYFMGLYNVAQVLFFIFKSHYFFYPSSYLLCDLLVLISTCLLEMIRLRIGKEGNLTEGQLHILMCLFLTVSATMGTVYVVVWQTYLLNIELILASITFVFHGLEFLYCVTLTFGFAKKSVIS